MVTPSVRLAEQDPGNQKGEGTQSSYEIRDHEGVVSRLRRAAYDPAREGEEAERGEDPVKQAYREALEKLAKHKQVSLTDLVNCQYQGVLRNHDQVKALRNIARAS